MFLCLIGMFPSQSDLSVPSPAWSLALLQTGCFVSFIFNARPATPLSSKPARVPPLIEDAAIDKVQRHIDDALSKGGRLQGMFFEPTVVADATADMLCAREETFGPLAPVFRFSTDDQAIQAANDTEFGLASYFYSRDIGRIYKVAEALEYGMVGINVGILASEHVPFGGVKQSGLGREGSHHAMDDYLEIKYLCMGDIF